MQSTPGPQTEKTENRKRRREWALILLIILLLIVFSRFENNLFELTAQITFDQQHFVLGPD